MSNYSIAVIPGDGIGQEVTREGLKVLETVSKQSGLSFKFTEFDLGATKYLKSGETLTDNDLAELVKFDAILLGAVGDPRVAPGVFGTRTTSEIAFRVRSPCQFTTCEIIAWRCNSAGK